MNQIRNFRQLGGIKTSLGTVKDNKILRGGPLSKLSNDDYNKFVRDYQLNTVIDFRNSHEINNEPNSTHNHVTVKHLPIMKEESRLQADPDKMLEELKITTSIDFMYDIYRSFVDNEDANKSYHEFLMTFAENEGATYFHCTAGKDRTGFAAALLLKILGADCETIMKDYLETNNNVLKHREELIASVMKFHPFDETDEDLVMGIIGVKESFLLEAFKEIDRIYGSFDAYLEDGLNLNEKTLDIIRQNLLE